MRVTFYPLLAAQPTEAKDQAKRSPHEHLKER